MQIVNSEMDLTGPGIRIDNAVRKLYAKKDTDFLLRESQMCKEIKEKRIFNTQWNLLGRSQFEKGLKKSLPGSYRAVLNRKNGQDKGCLFWDTKNPGHGKVEGNFQLLVAKNNAYPTIKYSQKCLLCKTDLIWASRSNPKKIWRHSLKLDHQMEELGYMISRNVNDFSVHQQCLDYAYGQKVVQDYNEVPGIDKLDGYKIDVIKSIRGRKCCYCHGIRAVTTCAHSLKCKKFYHLHCAFKNGCLQIPSEKRSYCHHHAPQHIHKLSLPSKVDPDQLDLEQPELQASKKRKGRKRKLCSFYHETSTIEELQSCNLISAQDEIEQKGFVEVIEIIDVSTLPDPDPHDPDNPDSLENIQVTDIHTVKQEQFEDFSDEDEDLNFDESSNDHHDFQVTIEATTEKCKLCEKDIGIDDFIDHLVKNHLVLKSYVNKSIIYPVTCTEKNCRRSLDKAKDFINHLIKDHNKARIHYDRMVKMVQQEENAKLRPTIDITDDSSMTSHSNSIPKITKRTSSFSKSVTSKTIPIKRKKLEANVNDDVNVENDSTQDGPMHRIISTPKSKTVLQNLKEELEQQRQQIDKLIKENQGLVMSKQDLLMKTAELEIEKEALKVENADLKSRIHNAKQALM